MDTKKKGKSSGIWLAVKEKGMAVRLGGVAVVFLLLMQCGCSRTNDIGSDWKYTGEYFDSVFEGFPKDEGEIYQHLPRAVGVFGMVLNDSYLPPIKVMQATKKGNLVEIEDSDRVIWVETKRRYEDGEPLDAGYYIRRGTMEYETALGAERTVPRYVEVNDKKLLAKVEKVKQELEAEEEAKEALRKAEEEAREAQRKAEEAAKEKAEEAAAEQGAYELDIPVKSLCGFKLGAPPSQVQNLLLNDDGTPVLDLYKRGQGPFQLAKPFRLFTRAEVDFMDNSVGQHLRIVTLSVPLEKDVSRESYMEEAKVLSEFIEKKFGIKFDGSSNSLGQYRWYGENETIKIGLEGRAMEGCSVLYLEVEVESSVMYKLDTKAISERKTNIHLDNDVGFDDL